MFFKFKKFKIKHTLFVLVIFLAALISNGNKALADATVDLGVTVNGAITITDDSNDTSAGVDPTINTNINITPSVGSAVAFGTSNFRVRSNISMWQLTSQRSGFNPGTTGLDETDISLSVTKTAGATGDSASCTLQSPFSGITDLSEVSTSSATPLCVGSSKTSASRNNDNTTNYVKFQVLYFVNQDFFFTPGTATESLTFSVSSI